MRAMVPRRRVGKTHEKERTPFDFGNFLLLRDGRLSGGRTPDFHQRFGFVSLTCGAGMAPNPYRGREGLQNQTDRIPPFRVHVELGGDIRRLPHIFKETPEGIPPDRQERIAKNANRQRPPDFDTTRVRIPRSLLLRRPRFPLSALRYRTMDIFF